jgi:hypothetical protein
MNPELRRNLWMEFSLHRLIGMPVVLGLVFALFGTMTGTDWRGSVFAAALWAFVLLAHFWGSRQASGAVADEVRDRTWDWQRLSALSPWQITWGKLFGATSFTWYGAAVSLVAIVITAPSDRLDVGWVALALVASAIALHAAAITGSLQASRKDSRLGQRIGGIVMIPIAFALLGAFTTPWWQHANGITWYANQWPGLRFGALSALAFAAWAVLGAFREMSRELKVRTLPWALPAFIVFVAAYAAGFNPPRGIATTSFFLFAGLATSVVLTYYMLFADLTTLMVARRIATRAAAGDWQRVLEELPLWVAPLVVALAFALFIPQMADADFAGARFRSMSLYPIAFALLVARDAGVLLFFALSAKARRVEAAALLYFVLLWWVIPGLLTAAGAKAVAQFFLPFGREMGGWQATVIAALHVAIAWSLVAWRWHRAQASFRPV